MTTEKIKYAWSKDSMRRYHRVPDQRSYRQTRCSLWTEHVTTEITEIPPHLTPCPRCFPSKLPPSA